MSTLREMGVLTAFENESIPDCVLDEDLDSYFMSPISSEDYKSAVYAIYFFSGPQDSPSAKSYVFYFYKDDKVNAYAKPDNIMTFKVRFKYPDRIHQIDQYLGGMAFGTINAPTLAEHEDWYPGWMSEDGKREIAELQAGNLRAASEVTVRSYQFPDPEKERSELEKNILSEDKKESEGMSPGKKALIWVVGLTILYLIFFHS